MSERIYNVLFLCTGNSARSIMAEAILNRMAGERFRAHSAGSYPKEAVHPMTLRLLRQLGIATEGLRSKSWDEFAGADAPPMDFVFTVCDRAASEPCPVWPGQPVTAHWGTPDPAAAEGDERQRLQAFRAAYRELEQRLRLFVNLPLDRLDRLRLQGEVEAIGRRGVDRD
ncbi:protein-tyrosine phosphatase, low molecular weight [Salinisphaera sp. PC39]|uniref:arsenate reductase ArsC n=1 Tax=Salinisphaera sp. PC39 TaxID=1304156 RepID=UPI0033403265